MHFILSIIVHTANILGAFNDPFEFEGDYGKEINPIRQECFEQIIDHDLKVSDVLTSDLVIEFMKRDFDPLLFLELYGDDPVLEVLKAHPGCLVLDKVLRNQTARHGELFDLPILNSGKELTGTQSSELKRHLLNILLERHRPTPELFYFWLFHARNLQLISKDPLMIEEVNFVKDQFNQTFGNLEERARQFKESILKTDSDVLFTQECDEVIPTYLTEFHAVNRQNPSDGCFIFLRKDIWDDYEPIYVSKKLNIILSKNKQSGERFLLASCHGHSTNFEDALLKINLIMQKFHKLNICGLQLIIGIDANTKSESEITRFRSHLDQLGLVATNVGPTTVKKRMISAQLSKTGKIALDEEDYIIILKNGSYRLDRQTVGFKEEPIDTNSFLPNIHNLSDHYPVGVTLNRF